MPIPDRLIQIGLILILLLAPTQYSLELMEKTHVSLVDPIIALVTIIWAWQIWRRRQWRELKRLPLINLLFVLLALASILRATHLLPALKDGLQYLEYFVVLYLLMVCNIPSRLRINVAGGIFLAAASLVIIIGNWQYFFSDIAAFAVRGTFGNRNVMGGFLSLCLPLFTGLLLSDHCRIRRTWYALMLLLAIPLLLSGASLIAVVVGLTLIAARHGQRTLACTLVLLTLLIMLALPRLPRENLEVARESIAVYDGDGEPTPRYPEWQAAARMMLDHPQLGVGIGNYQKHVGMYYGIIPSVPEKSEADSQNMYLVLGASLGLAGPLLFLGLLFHFLQQSTIAATMLTDPFQHGLAIGIQGALAAFAVNCIWTPLLVRGIGVVLVLLFALATVLRTTTPVTRAFSEA